MRQRTAPLLPLLPPAPHGDPLQRGEDQCFHRQADQHHQRQAGEHVVGVQLVAVLEDVPAQPALAGRGAEDQLSSDQRAPGEGSSDLEA